MRGLNTNSPARAGSWRERDHRPAGDDVGEARHVVLGVDGAHAERMQLEDFAREILVETALLPLAGDRVRADRARIVEIDQHRRMGLDRQQHVGEAAEHVRADRLALVGAADRTHAALVGGDAEMIRPEPDEPFGEADVGAERGMNARLGLVEIDLLRHGGTGIRGAARAASTACRVLRRRTRSAPRLAASHRCCSAGPAAPPLRGLARYALLLLKLEGRARRLAARRQIRIGDPSGARPVELGQQRAARIGRDRGDRPGARAETEAMKRQCCF